MPRLFTLRSRIECLLARLPSSLLDAPSFFAARRVALAYFRSLSSRIASSFLLLLILKRHVCSGGTLTHAEGRRTESEEVAPALQKLVAPELQEPEEVITSKLQELASDSEMVPNLYVLVVIPSMSTVKHGIVCTRRDSDALVVVSSTWYTQSAP